MTSCTLIEPLWPQERIQKNSMQGEGHESQWCPYLYPKFKNSMDFGYFISVVPYFQFFIFIFFKLFCSWQACAGP